VKCVVLKISGHLIKMPAELRRLLSTVEEVHRECQPVVVIPGGSIFADAVLELQRCIGFSDGIAHWMAIKAMEIYGIYITMHSSIGVEVEDLGGVERVIEKGLLPIILPYRVAKRFDELPHSWSVTSDSIAILVAGKLGCEKVFLAKLVDGITVDGHVVREIKAKDLSLVHQTVVDEYTARAVDMYGVEVVVFNALKPSVLKEVACRGYTKSSVYTLIKP